MKKDSKIFHHLVEFCALQGSIKCFKYLFINYAKLVRERTGMSIISCAISGGCVEIIQLIEQFKIHPKADDIKYAIIYHRVEVFDWFVEQFREIKIEDCPDLCTKSEFVHGILHIESMNPQTSFESSCESGFISLTKILLSSFSLNVTNGFFQSCKYGHTEVVKLLLAHPSIDINQIVTFYFFQYQFH